MKTLTKILGSALTLFVLALFSEGALSNTVLDQKTEPFNFDQGYHVFTKIKWVYNTQHFSMYYDTSTIDDTLGHQLTGQMYPALERDYAKLRYYFGWEPKGVTGTGGKTRENPNGKLLNIILYRTKPNGGSGHIGEGDTILNISIDQEPHDTVAQLTLTYAVELTQLFFEKIPAMHGGDLGPSFDPGLSLSMAQDLHPTNNGNRSWAYIWINDFQNDPNGARFDYVNNNPPTVMPDGKYDLWAVTCAFSYYYWLRYELNYPWKNIMDALKRSKTLADVYHLLTKTDASVNAFTPFLADINRVSPPNKPYPSNIFPDNPFYKYPPENFRIGYSCKSTSGLPAESQINIQTHFDSNFAMGKIEVTGSVAAQSLAFAVDKYAREMKNGTEYDLFFYRMPTSKGRAVLAVQSKDPARSTLNFESGPSWSFSCH